MMAVFIFSMMVSLHLASVRPVFQVDRNDKEEIQIMGRSSRVTLVGSCMSIIEIRSMKRKRMKFKVGHSHLLNLIIQSVRSSVS